MLATSLEALFERYRSQGDLAALGQVFDRTSRGLLGLAVHLVRDPVEAEDVVQATFVAALEGAASFQAGRRLEPWLAGILARQAARVWRQRGRASETRAELEVTLDPSLEAERRELAEALELALARLEPRERDVLRRYLDGESPLDIARAQGRGSGAVRMQVLRGLERLRRLLPVGLHAMAPLARLPRGLASVRADVLARAEGTAVLAPATLVPASIVPVSIGVLAVSTKLVLASLAVTAALFLCLRGGGAEPEGARPAPEPAGVASLALEPTGPRRAPEEPDGSASSAREERAAEAPRSPTPPPEPAPGVWLVGALTGLLPELDPRDALVQVWTSVRPPLETRASSDGRYAIDVTRLLGESASAPLLYASARHPWPRHGLRELRIPEEARRASPDARLELTLDLELPARTAVVGRIEVEPESEASIEAQSIRVALVDAKLEVVCESACESGERFELFPASSGALELFVQARGALPRRLALEVPADEVTDAGLVRLASGDVVLAGDVRVPFAAELAGLFVGATRIGLPEGGPSWDGVELESVRVRQAFGPIAEDGSFVIRGLEPGEYELSLAQHLDGDRAVLAYAGLTVSAPARGIVFGEHLGRIAVSLRGQGGRLETARLLLPVGSVLHQLEVDASERFQLIADRRAELALRAEAPGWQGARVELAPLSWPSEHEVTLVLESRQELAALELEWDTPEGFVAPESVTAFWRRDDANGDASGDASASASAGGCRFEGWTAGHYRLVLAPRSPRSWEPLPGFSTTLSLEVELVAGRTARARVEWVSGGRARFVPDASARPGLEGLEAEVRDAYGERQPVRFAMREWSPDGTLQMGSFPDSLPLAWASELEPNLLPGAYTLVLREAEGEPFALPFVIRAGEVVEVPVVLP
jgi:RNA polymerase sigma-70 factor, ECF subfamily